MVTDALAHGATRLDRDKYVLVFNNLSRHNVQKLYKMEMYFPNKFNT